MSTEPEQKPGMPWQWKLALVRLALAVGIAFCGIMYAFYQGFIGNYGAFVGWGLLTMFVSRAVAGRLLEIADIGRK